MPLGDQGGKVVVGSVVMHTGGSAHLALRWI
jgi:hypothetical protein